MHMSEQGLAPHRYDSIFAFSTTGDDPQDQFAVLRSPGATRPLSLKNCDAKLIAHVVNMGLADM
eukprot:6147424-Pyramimonas_sp.AAC.1